MDDIIVELAAAVRSFLDVEDAAPWGNPDVVLVRSQSTAWIAFTIVRNYTRGVGFSVDDNGVWSVDPALQAVIVSTAARYGALGPSVSDMSLTEFRPTEKAVLHQFRKVAG